MSGTGNERAETFDYAETRGSFAGSEHTAVSQSASPPGELLSNRENEKAGQTSDGTNAPPIVSRHAHIDEQANTIAPAKTKSSTRSNGESIERKETMRERREAEAIAAGKQIITEEDCYEELGFCFPTWKKWMILSVIFIVQVSMNFNTSLYSNAIPGISEEFGVSEQAARVGAMIFLVLYAFGCELWAPWSEELGRWPILQLSLFLVNIWQIPVGVAPNFATIIVGRALGGISSAGGSVTLGMIADMWEADEQQYAVAFVVFSSVGGSVLGPIVGGFIQQFAAWRWNIWVQLIFGGVVQLLHACTVPETRTTILMDKIARKRRLDPNHPQHNPNLYGPDEPEIISFKDRFSAKEIVVTWIRPFKMFLTEPIVLVLSLLSGFSDALIFMFIQSFSLVYGKGVPTKGYNGWGFNDWQVGLTFVPIGIGYLIAWALFIPAIWRNKKQRAQYPNDERKQYESRLEFLLWAVPCLPIGLIGFAWTCTGPPLPWIASSIFAAVVGIANYSIYMATIDYMICAYGPYSASATGGNGWSRDFLAGVLTIPATPFFENIGSNPLAYASTILFCISFMLVLAVYAVYYYGPTLRKRSPFAQQLSHAREEKNEDRGDGEKRRLSRLNTAQATGATARSNQEFNTRRTTGSRSNSYAMQTHPRSNPHTPARTPANSRPASIDNGRAGAIAN